MAQFAHRYEREKYLVHKRNLEVNVTKLNVNGRIENSLFSQSSKVTSMYISLVDSINRSIETADDFSGPVNNGQFCFLVGDLIMIENEILFVTLCIRE